MLLLMPLLLDRTYAIAVGENVASVVEDEHGVGEREGHGLTVRFCMV